MSDFARFVLLYLAGLLLYVAAPLLLMVLGAAALVIEGWRIGRLPAELDTALFRRSGP